jgi:hypothetical protein
VKILCDQYIERGENNEKKPTLVVYHDNGFCWRGVVTLTGCGTVITKADPVTLTLWHVYGEQTDSPLNDLIDEFNETVGAEKGIKIEVTMVSNTNSVHEAVLRAAKRGTGAVAIFPICLFPIPRQFWQWITRIL